MVLRSALKLYTTKRVKVNTAYTPKRMLKTASFITGQRYKRGQYAEAIADLTTWLEAQQ